MPPTKFPKWESVFPNHRKSFRCWVVNKNDKDLQL